MLVSCSGDGNVGADGAAILGGSLGVVLLLSGFLGSTNLGIVVQGADDLGKGFNEVFVLSTGLGQDLFNLLVGDGDFNSLSGCLEQGDGVKGKSHLGL